ncbi:hypothetical protein [Pedobacter mucosus]|uniref:hypothetical protein n=1 Tax=Pedobacter mucosus TaxID=2895286 RepID=UPI001EE46FE1|nr:hypothetical protein [Pedobacter mucosus]UKT63939.1 hypothetical protein LOK61_19485 [Pedobacter mucosus]
MNIVTEFFKLFFLFLIAMLGAGHSAVEASSLIKHTSPFVFGFRYNPTLWTLLLSLIVTVSAFLFATKIALNIGKSYKKDR